jgi:hypothetical protein
MKLLVDTTEEMASELEDRPIEIIQTEVNSKNNMNRVSKNWSYKWNGERTGQEKNFKK